jgi:hypothetical protein
MDSAERRLLTVALTVLLVLALVAFMTWGVLHKINEKILKPNEGLGPVDVMTTQKAK